MSPPLRRLFVSALALLALTASVAGAAVPTHEYVPGQLIIKYRTGVAKQQRTSLLSDMRATPMRSFEFIRAEAVKLPDGVTVEQAIARYKSDPRVEYVEPNYIWHADVTPNDPLFPQLYGMHNTGQTGGTPGADIHATNAWDVYTGDPNLMVGVIDTGIDYNHPDLAANVWTNPGEIPGNGIDDDGDGYVDDVHGYDFANSDGDPFDDNGHGSHCSGTIAGIGNNGVGVVGVNWRAKLVAIKFLNASGSGTTDGAIAAVQYAIAVGCRLTSNSWGGGGFSQALLDAINAAGAAGQLFCAAAGNAGSDNDVTPFYPATYDTPYIIAVAATDNNDNLASFSNYGATTVDIAAPGVDILSCQPGGGYQLLSGTSMATPHVSGAVALAMGRLPGLTNLQIKDLILHFADVKPQLTGRVLSNGRLNAFMPIAEPDSTPPAAVTDLHVSDLASNSITLAWTAPGDDGNTGRASSYELRYSTAPINAGNFSSATLVPSPDPQPAGSAESFEVPGLAFNTLYYFAIKAHDEFNNAGDLSNVASGTTLGIPNIDASPTSFSSTLLTGATDSQTLTLSNTAEGTLDFTIPTPMLSTSHPQVVNPYQPYVKTAGDHRVGPPVITGSGGPDGFGYRWVDSDEPGGPPFSWVDITGVGTLNALSGDDNLSAPVTIGFSFPFYGSTFSTLRICTNGFITLSGSAAPYDNQMLPNVGAPPNLIAPMWDDMDFGTLQRVYTYNDGSRFIVEWVAIPHYSAGGSYTFEAILYPSGEIRYQYLSLGDPTNSATVGIQDQTAANGLNVAFNTTYLHDNLAVRIFAIPQWLSVTPTSGRILAGHSLPLQVHFDASGLTGGIFNGTINVLSNDPDGSPLPLSAQLHVIGAPDIAVNPASIPFGTVFVGSSPTRTLVVSNPGTDVLQVTGITSDDPYVSASPTTFSLNPSGAQNVTVTYHPTTVSSSNATLTIASNDPDQPNEPVMVTGNAVPAPSFSVDPESLAVTLNTNTATSRNLRITNNGGSNYTFSAEAIITSQGSSVVKHDADNLPLQKGQPDLQHGPSATSHGGPDVFGYTYQDSDEPGGPTFNWVDITGVGTQIPLTGDDANAGTFPVGFQFPFYGTTFNSFRICTNGFVSFTSNLTTYTNAAIPNNGAGVPENLLAVFWDDMNFGTTPRTYYYNDGARLIIEYFGAPRYGETVPNTFEILLYPDGRIVYQYLSMQSTTLNSATVGIQNADRSDGLQAAFNTSYVHDNLAVQFRPPARFLTVTPDSGSVPPGSHMDLTVGFNAAGLFGGNYLGAVRLTGNDPILPQRDVPCRLTVIGVPDIATVPTSVAFNNVYIGAPQLRQLTVQNVGTDLLHVTNITSDNGAFGVDQTSFNIGPLSSAVVYVGFNPGLAQPYSGNLHISSDDPDTPDLAVPVSGTGVTPPEIGVAPGSLHVALATTLGPVAQTADRLLVISNTGGSDLTWSLDASLAGASAGRVAKPSAAPAASTAAARRPAPVAPDAAQVATLARVARASSTLLALPASRHALLPESSKNDPSPPGNPVTQASGGPDTFGYRWIDSDSPGGPTFAWQEISGVGTVIPLNSDDQTLGPFPLPFAFSLYGNAFNTFNICSNGFLSFTSTLDSYTNTPLPNAGAPFNLVAPFWDDQNFAASGQAFSYFDGTKFIIEFQNVAHFSSGGPYTYEVLLYPNGTIEYQYLSMQSTRINEATIGIQNADGTDGLQVVYNADYVHDNLRVRISRTPQWMSINRSSGVTPAGGRDTVVVHFDANGLADGDYAGNLHVSSNDLQQPSIDVPVALHVGVASASLMVDPDIVNSLSGPTYVHGTVTPPSGLDPHDIDPASVRMQGTVAIADSVPVDYPPGQAVFSFSRFALLPALTEGKFSPVELIGEVAGQTWFSARDTIRVLKPILYVGGPAPYSAGSSVPLTWQDAVDGPATHYDLWYSEDGGIHWSRIATAVTGHSMAWHVAPEATTRGMLQLAAYDDQGYLGSAFAGPFSIVAPITGVETLRQPEALGLRFIGANPARSAARLELALPQRGPVELRVHDVRGALVRTLASGEFAAGRYPIVWDGKDANGTTVGSGVYFVQAAAGGRTVGLRVALIH